MNPLQLFKVAVSAFIVKENKILILKRSDHETFLPGSWEVPGGGVDEGETIEQAVIRETKEEAGIDVTPKTLFGFFEYVDGYDQKTINLNFICTMNEKLQQPDTSFGEMEGVAWVASENLHDYPFTSETMQSACRDALQTL